MRRRKPVFVAAGVFLGLIGGFAVWIHVVAAGRWAETLRRTEEIEAELAAPLPRPPLRGAALPGDAAEDYAAAAENERGSAASDEELKILAAFAKGASGDAARARAAAERLADAAARLRSGARRERAGRFFGESAWNALQASRVQARLAASERRFGEAFAVWTDLLRVAGDLGEEGERDEILADLGQAMRAGGAGREALEALAIELEILERSLPPPGRELLAARNAVLKSALREGSFRQALQLGGLGWRHAGSSRLYFAGGSREIDLWASELAALQERPWTEAEARFRRALEEAQADGDGFREHVACHWEREMKRWVALARLRLARAAALAKAGGRAPALEDPFGGKLAWDDGSVRSKGPTDDPKDDIILRLK